MIRKLSNVRDVGDANLYQNFYDLIISLHEVLKRTISNRKPKCSMLTSIGALMTMVKLY